MLEEREEMRGHENVSTHDRRMKTNEFVDAVQYIGSQSGCSCIQRPGIIPTINIVHRGMKIVVTKKREKCFN